MTYSEPMYIEVLSLVSETQSYTQPLFPLAVRTGWIRRNGEFYVITFIWFLSGEARAESNPGLPTDASTLATVRRCHRSVGTADLAPDGCRYSYDSQCLA